MMIRIFSLLFLCIGLGCWANGPEDPEEVEHLPAPLFFWLIGDKTDDYSSYNLDSNQVRRAVIDVISELALSHRVYVGMSYVDDAGTVEQETIISDPFHFETLEARYNSVRLQHRAEEIIDRQQYDEKNRLIDFIDRTADSLSRQVVGQHSDLDGLSRKMQDVLDDKQFADMAVIILALTDYEHNVASMSHGRPMRETRLHRPDRVYIYCLDKTQPYDLQAIFPGTHTTYLNRITPTNFTLP